jgi:two-component system nitrate/nitrite sensor histidine kinase NarX
MSIRALWGRSTLVRISTVLGAITLLAIAVVLTAATVTEQSTGKGVAINVAGSLRMQSYRLAVQVADARQEPAAQEQSIARESAEFERRLHHSQLRGAALSSAALAAQYRRIGTTWDAEIRPLAAASAGSEQARTAFLDRVHPFVQQVDGFVQALESDLESRIHGLQVAIGAALFVIVVLVVSAFFLLDFQVFQPINQLVSVTQRVRRGQFGVRAARTGPDEIGQLGHDFNHMVEELGRLYGSLEAQIAAKTADLEQKNRSLALLYDTARELSAGGLDQPTLQRVAQRVRAALQVDGVVLCARRSGSQSGFPLARVETSPGLTCDLVRCDGCLHEARVIWHNADTERGPAQVVSVPLLDGERVFGVMPLTLVAGRQLAPWQLELAQIVGRHVGAALAAVEARDEHRRLALFEERSAIARELHDSLAQSLSYTKIQLARLSAELAAAPAGGGRPGAAQEIVDELRTGVSSAYRQLRELLTTFRLQLTGSGLKVALVDAIADFRARTGLAVELRDELIGVELSANEQMHVLQIVREALANVEHHAGAAHAWVSLRRLPAPPERAIEVLIEDDGCGIDSRASPPQHFGMAIMRDRAALLRGSIDIERRAPGGTRVRLQFVAETPFSDPGRRAGVESTPEAAAETLH